MLKNIIQLNTSVKLKILNLNNKKKILIFTEKQSIFFKIDNSISFIINKNLLCYNIFYIKKSKKETIIKYITSFIKNTDKLFRKKLILKGLGLKAELFNDNKYLELKLGFSEKKIIFLEKSIIKSDINKNILTFESYNSILLGNFLNRLKFLKMPDNYKGKGIWYKNEIKVLKTIKKK